MFVIKRNQVVVTALAVMISAAGYLNFQEGKSAEGTQTALELSEDGEETAVITDYETLPDDVFAEDITEDITGDSVAGDPVTLDPITAEASQTTGDGTAIFVNGDGMGESSQFFAEAKLDREQSRAKQKDILTEMIDNENVSKEQKDECGSSMMELQQRIEKETAAEAMIKSKGFAEVYVRMDDETVDVVVDKPNLEQGELAQIEDIVKRKTGFEADKIRINSLKK